MPGLGRPSEGMSVDWCRFKVRHAGSADGLDMGQFVEDQVIDDVGEGS
jgi:hypothetical protein